jgi:DNA polymerase/3'-5' exonuclease PolX
MKFKTYRPIGWQGESYRHYLAAKGVKTKYQKRFPELVKDFGGDNPRVTERFARFRQKSPKEFEPGTFRTKYQGDTELIVGKLKSTGKYAVQSILFKRDKYFVEKKVLKKGRIHTTRSGPEVVAVANEVKLAMRPYAVRVQVAGSIRRRQKDPTDVDIVVIPRSQKVHKLRERIKALADKVDAEGDKKIKMRVKGVPVDIRFAERADWGAQVLTWTGSSGHNIGLRRIAQRKGLKLNEYGLYRGDTRIAGNSEREIYRKLGRPQFKQPWQR